MKRRPNLLALSRPSRYIDNEINSIKKGAPVRIALAFPDIYDVGMSHLGLKILYSIINDIPYASAERVFSPWPDMEDEMRRLNYPLCSLESNSPLKEFDLIGFSLQYELSYTTVLNMLDLAGIPIRSDERGNSDPIILAGGPCTVNPLPMTSFIDAFLIGEGEEAIREIVDVIYTAKGKREDILQGLSGIEGIYVPSIHGFGERPLKIRRRIVENLDSAPYPLSPIVPFTPIVHDRITIEVSRGCSRGCRFCQAGMIYRPLRERRPERIVEIARESLKNTGYEEISLSSLSTGDYCQLIPLLKEMNRTFSGKFVSISLPSLRVASVSRDVLREIKMVRKTGFTIAPEAATERLRRVINKDVSDDDYEKALHALFSEGWENLKLYFMIGLPEERWEDVEAIPEMALRAIKVAKRYSQRFVNVSVTVSPFVPKPHTPFQWQGQELPDSIREKLDYLKERLKEKGINYKGHDPDVSLLEAVLSRGDQKVSNLIEEAWKRGAKLDAWTEWFDLNKWLTAGEFTGIDLKEYATKNFPISEQLPWDLVDTGIKKDFLVKELNRALSGERTSECRERCYGCGLGCTIMKEMKHEALHREDTSIHPRQDDKNVDSRKTVRELQPSIRVRVEFQKSGLMRYLSHRELMSAIIRAVRRTGIPILYSRGFHPSPRLSFGPPLSVGVSGLKEYFDMEIQPEGLRLNIIDMLNDTLPEGLRINRVCPVSKSAPSLDSFIKRYEYEIICSDSTIANEFISKDSFIIEREDGRGRKRTIDLKTMIELIEVVDNKRVRLILIDGEEKVRLNEFIQAMFFDERRSLFEVRRTGLYGRSIDGSRWIEPLPV